nr:MAG TPA: hypothetical protein [Caudoviricetes sp.]
MLFYSKNKRLISRQVFYCSSILLSEIRSALITIPLLFYLFAC